MNGVWKCVLILIGVLALSVPASATVITFEDLDPGYAAADRLPDGYAGFTWGGPADNWWMTEDFAPNSGYQNTITMVPGSRVGTYTADAAMMSMSHSPFRLNSLNIGAAWNDDQFVTVAGYLNGNLVDSDYFMAPVAGMSRSFNWGWIDSVEITPDWNTGTHHSGYDTGAGHHVALDQIDYAAAPPGLPAFALVGAAPIVGGIVRRLRRR
jgi:hypothetical protein